MKSTTYLRLFRLRRLTRFFVLLAALGLVAGSDFSRVEISCNEHLASAGLGHFKDMERGVIRDSKTNLDWFRCPVGQRHIPRGCSGEPLLLSLAETENYISEMAEKAGAKWRLPNYSEFATITRNDCLNPALNPNAFPNILIENFWTKGVGVNSRKACVVFTLNGARSCRVIDRDTPRPFLMVKDAS
jgi:hypothetical protein